VAHDSRRASSESLAGGDPDAENLAEFALGRKAMARRILPGLDLPLDDADDAPVVRFSAHGRCNFLTGMVMML
jgi:hypothetical protein